MTPEQKARRAEYMKRWRAEHPEALHEYYVKYRKTHKKQIKEACRKYYETHKDELIKKQSAYHAEWQRKNAEHLRKYNRLRREKLRREKEQTRD